MQDSSAAALGIGIGTTKHSVYAEGVCEPSLLGHSLAVSRRQWLDGIPSLGIAHRR